MSPRSWSAAPRDCPGAPDLRNGWRFSGTFPIEPFNFKRGGSYLMPYRVLRKDELPQETDDTSLAA